MTIPQPRAGIGHIRAHMQTLPEAPTARVIKLASNESAFGPSPGAIAAASSIVPDMARYAEQGTGELEQAIAERFGLDPTRIVCGPGSDELITRIARTYLDPGDELIHSVRGYAKFPNYAWACDAIPVAAADKDFRADVESILACVTPRTRLVTLANPDNPTGSYLSDVQLRALRAGLPERAILLVDCAYGEYVDAADYGEPARLVDEFPNVIMTRTFSKIFGMAGARLGWAYAAPDVADVLRRMGMTFPVNAASLAAGIAAMRDGAHLEHVYEQNRRLRRSFSEALSQAGVKVYPSQGNFVLADFGSEARAVAAYETLLREGVLTRRLGPAFVTCVRITIGLPDEMSLCERVLLEHLARQPG